MPSFEELSEDQRANLARAGFKLFHNPEVSRDAKRLLTRADPKVRFPEIEAEESTNAQLRERDDRIAKLESQQIEADLERRLETKRRQAEDLGIDPMDVEKLIVERGKNGRIIDWESALELIQLQQQSAAASPSTDDFKVGNEMPGIAEMINAGPEGAAKIARELTHKAITEMKGRRQVGAR
jgi:hypothetical protein